MIRLLFRVMIGIITIVASTKSIIKAIDKYEKKGGKSK